MDRFIKSVPVILGLGLLILIWQSGGSDYSNTLIAFVCAAVVFMLTAIVYILMHHFKQPMMAAKYYIYVMFAAGLLTFTVLYTGLEYFYT